MHADVHNSGAPLTTADLPTPYQQSFAGGAQIMQPSLMLSSAGSNVKLPTVMSSDALTSFNQAPGARPSDRSMTNGMCRMINLYNNIGMINPSAGVIGAPRQTAGVVDQTLAAALAAMTQAATVAPSSRTPLAAPSAGALNTPTALAAALMLQQKQQAAAAAAAQSSFETQALIQALQVYI
jgi:hypothetical protein